MALQDINITINLEGESTVDYTSIIVATEEQARVFNVTVPTGYEAYTLNARIQNADDDIFLIPVISGEFTLNADVLVNGNLYMQFELTSGTEKIVDNTMFIFGLVNAIPTDVTSQTTEDWQLMVEDHIADTTIHFELPDKTGNELRFLQLDSSLNLQWGIGSGGGGSGVWGFIVGNIADQLDLQSALNGKADTIHTHTIGQVTDLQTELDGKADAVHTHTITDVTGLQTALDGKANLLHSHTEAQITNLDKYTQAQVDSLLAGKANTVHTHVKTDITDFAHTHVEADITDLGNYITDAPVDGSKYGRLNGAWSVINEGAGSSVWGGITGTLSNQLDLQSALDAKANLVHTHVEADITDFGNYSPVGHTHVEANITDLDKYTQAQVNTLLAGKADVSHTHVELDITNLDKYTQAEVDALLAGKANTVHTHTESQITDLDKYTQAQVDTFLSTKVDTSTTVNSYPLNANVTLDADDIDDTLTTHKFTTAGDISKLAGIEAGAEVNVVDTVNGQTGAVVLDKTDVGLGNVVNVDTTNADNISDGTTNAIVTLTQESNFETAYSHTALTDNPHSVTAEQAGALEETNNYYNNSGSGTDIWVRFATIKFKSTYQKVRFIMNVGIGGNARDYGKLEVQIDGGATYNSLLASTHFNMVSTTEHFASDAFMYETIDNGANDFDIILWAKVDAYAVINCTIVDKYQLSITGTEFDLLPDTPTTSATEPTGVTYFDSIKLMQNRYLEEYTMATGGETTVAIGLVFDSTKDAILVHLNGEKLVKTLDFTYTDTTITLIGITLVSGDIVETEIFTNMVF